MKRLACGVLLSFLMTASAVPAQKRAPADAIYFHGNILTGVDLESAHPQRVSAMAVKDGVVVAT
ncbi:MAG TPA: hypothetical protein VFJ10_18040, partial [Acidobacteriaceae bacterium]|nr:hypothetical protein [Acidobacteriaceae bacterium]